jgi:hypothetical protein
LVRVGGECAPEFGDGEFATIGRRSERAKPHSAAMAPPHRVVLDGGDPRAEADGYRSGSLFAAHMYGVVIGAEVLPAGPQGPLQPRFRTYLLYQLPRGRADLPAHACWQTGAEPTANRAVNALLQELRRRARTDPRVRAPGRRSQLDGRLLFGPPTARDSVARGTVVPARRRLAVRPAIAASTRRRRARAYVAAIRRALPDSDVADVLATTLACGPGFDRVAVLREAAAASGDMLRCMQRVCAERDDGRGALSEVARRFTASRDLVEFDRLGLTLAQWDALSRAHRGMASLHALRDAYRACCDRVAAFFGLRPLTSLTGRTLGWALSPAAWLQLLRAPHEFVRISFGSDDRLVMLRWGRRTQRTQLSVGLQICARGPRRDAAAIAADVFAGESFVTLAVVTGSGAEAVAAAVSVQDEVAALARTERGVECVLCADAGMLAQLETRAAASAPVGGTGVAAAAAIDASTSAFPADNDGVEWEEPLSDEEGGEERVAAAAGPGSAVAAVAAAAAAAAATTTQPPPRSTQMATRARAGAKPCPFCSLRKVEWARLDADADKFDARSWRSPREVCVDVLHLTNSVDRQLLLGTAMLVAERCPDQPWLGDQLRELCRRHEAPGAVAGAELVLLQAADGAREARLRPTKPPKAFHAFVVQHYAELLAAYADGVPADLVACWAQWAALRDVMWSPTTAQRAWREVRRACVSFVRLFLFLFGAEAVFLYLHMCQCHVWQFVREHGAIVQFCRQAQEQAHGEAKRRIAQHLFREGFLPRGARARTEWSADPVALQLLYYTRLRLWKL